MESKDRRPAVFLDRDGTINVEVDYLADPADLELLPGVPAAVAALNRADFRVVVVTNQSGIARGVLDEAALETIHDALTARLARAGARVDAIYHCPHHPTEGVPPWRASCECRKPRPGMLVRAAAELGLDLTRSWIVGDSVRDLEAGAALGVPGILVATGKGALERASLARIAAPTPLFLPDLPAAVRHILAASGRPASAAQGR